MKQEEKKLSGNESLILTNEIERLKRDIYRPDMEKLQLFTRMPRTNMLLKKAVFFHKDYTNILELDKFKK
jgi:hypothetical protein